mmetsp:Transcript_17853/g.35252  ORF Transcript_17853/g.35252 Transcript_17853/m.35252 type:complete len:85 (+) Transcript_17853:3-257(+)
MQEICFRRSSHFRVISSESWIRRFTFQVSVHHTQSSSFLFVSLKKNKTEEDNEMRKITLHDVSLLIKDDTSVCPPTIGCFSGNT